MRPPRIVILALFFVACLFLLCRAITSAAGTTAAGVVNSPGHSQKSGLRSLLSFSAPFALFLPNAVITIAEDNTTSFAARPAGFGAQLPAKGLNGQLWIGSGFTEETLQDDVGEGELGCSDVPGWNDGTSNAAVLKSTFHKAPLDRPKALSAPGGKNSAQNKREKGGKDAATVPDTKSKAKKVTVDDGTDDYLHQALEASQKLQVDGSGLSGSGHADIQSIQEGAEIAGKIVLLSRGGCGFLEKVKWAQRRGAIALIVGDNVRGGALIQMYAHGDTSNVTIPSVFTSRTTAYLLSLMMQPGSYIEDFIDENGKPTQKVQHSDKARQNRNSRRQPLPGSTSPSSKDSTTQPRTAAAKNAVLSTSADSNKPTPKSRGWLARFFSWGTTSSAAVKSRPPSSGQHDWVLVEDFSDEKDRIIQDGIEKASKGAAGSKSKPGAATGDTFQIGVQDWRDPDLVGAPAQDAKSSQEEAGKGKSKAGGKGPKSGSSTSKQDGKGKAKEASGPKGGSITPGSGEYAAEIPTSPKADTEETSTKPSTAGGFFSRIFGSHGSVESNEHIIPPPINTPIVQKPAPGEKIPSNPPPGQHDGLWIVITPTSSASPFLDTLLVLVISPLITLTVVYALLILRARIRRRRWRAPKSVVERLPVRTYHTVASTPSHSPRVSTPTPPSPPSPPSPTTPLLQSQHGPSRHRPRSRTTTGVAGDLLQVNSGAQSSGSPPHEKPSQWKKYMGRQVECVVCLEEYVDGVSQVMSLPCGHEFHVECITPWLTTRRRTCPICKGDVVRSLARGSPSSPRYEPYRDDSDDDFSAEATSSSFSSGQTGRSAGGRQDEADSDVEQGILSPQPARSAETGAADGWLGMVSHSLRSLSTWSRPQSVRPVEDRDR